MHFSPALLFGLLLVWTSVSGQKARFKPFDRPKETHSSPVSGTFHVVGVMVQFQPDDNRFTTGTGQFNPDFLNRPGILIDPLPHDAGYFEAHLAFAKHYFETVSNGAVQLQTHLIPGVVTLAKTMDAYSPLESDTDETVKLAQLAAETWSAVANSGNLTLPALDPDRTAWVIFHAGAGRDIELLGTTLDKTPQDIPSLYLSSDRLRTLLPSQFPEQGFPVGAANRVKNTLLVPETESRPGKTIDDSVFVLQLGINGILCANIGSFLGMPDLFNTENGQSGIGQFGLMDGAGFFAMAGVFPPQPSAWEKLYMGWTSPRTLDREAAGSFSLNALSGNAQNLPLKIPGSGFEYFLVENRHRNPDPAGVTVTIRRPDGTLVQQQFSPESYHFDQMNTDSLVGVLEPGVITAVSHYDRALPGGVDFGDDDIFQSSDRILNGGILIWHIDEAVIQTNLASNSINNRLERRGVSLQEADSGDDIGNPEGSISAALSGGSPFDFWWNGNDSRVILPNGSEISFYQNRFAGDTKPSNRLYSGIFPGFSLSQFSENKIEATLEIAFSGPAPVQTFHIASLNANRILDISVTAPAGDTTIVVYAENRLFFGLMKSGSLTDSVSFPAGTGGSLLSKNEVVFLLEPSVLRAYRYVNGQWSAAWTTNLNTTVSTRILGGTSLAFPQTQPAYIAIQGTGIQVDAADGQRQPAGQPVFFSADQQISMEEARFRQETSTVETPLNRSTGKKIWVFEKPSGNTAAAADETGIWFSKTGFFKAFANAAPVFWRTAQGNPVVTLVSDDNTLSTLTESGASIPNWPVSMQVTDCSTVSLFNKGDSTLLFFKEQQNGGQFVSALHQDGKRSSGPAGTHSVSIQDGETMIFGFHNTLFVAEAGGTVQMLSLPGFEAVYNTSGGDPRTGTNLASLLISSDDPAPGTFSLNKAETYVWPNPATDLTNIRVQTGAAGKISVVVSDQGGGIQARRQFESTGTLAQDFQLDTSGWPSGVYFVVVKAGKTSKLLKLAVIR